MYVDVDEGVGDKCVRCSAIGRAIGAHIDMQEEKENGGQVLKFSGKPVDSLKLLEVDEELLGSIVNEGAVFKAVELSDKIVLCTSDKTYAVKSVETSNSILLIDDISEFSNEQARVNIDVNSDEVGPVTQMEGAVEGKDIEICAALGEHWEIEEIHPDLSQLTEILRRRSYAGSNDKMIEGDGIESPGYSTEELFQSIQASELELMGALQECGAFLMDNKWQILEESYLSSFLDILIGKISQNKWSRDALPLADLLNILHEDDFRKEVSLHCIRQFGVAPMFVDSIDENSKASLDTGKICRHYARSILRKSPKWKLKALMDQWVSRVPVGMEPTTEMLEGLVLKEATGADEELIYLPIDSLPGNAKKRFEILFSYRKKFKEEDLKPYLKGIVVPPGNSIDSIIEDNLHSFKSANNVTMYVKKDF